MRQLVDAGEDIKIVGIVQAAEDANGAFLTSGIGYLPSLTKHVVEQAKDSRIVKEQLANPQVNVFTGEAFGEESGEKEFDTGSLFTVDEEKLKEAFGFDETAFQGISGSFDFSSAFGQAAGSMDLSGMVDLSGISIQLPETPQLNLAELMQGVEIHISSEELEALAGDLMNGYQEYKGEHALPGYEELQADFNTYLGTEEAKAIIKENLDEIVSAGGETLTAQQLEALAGDLMAGYESYAEASGGSVVSAGAVMEGFRSYLAEQETKKLLSDRLAGAVDTSAI